MGILCVCVFGRSGVASSCVATGPLTVALALALIQKHRRSCVGRRVASPICRLLQLFPLLYALFSVFARLAGSAPRRPFFRVFTKEEDAHVQVRGVIRSADGGDRWRRSGGGVGAQV